MTRRLIVGMYVCATIVAATAKADIKKKAEGDTPPFFVMATGKWKSRKETEELSKIIRELTSNNLSTNWNVPGSVLVQEIDRLSEALQVALPAGKSKGEAIVISISITEKTKTTTMEFMRLDLRGGRHQRLQKYELRGTAPTLFSGDTALKVKEGLVIAMASIRSNLRAVELELRDGANPPTVVGADSSVDDSRPQRISAVPFSDAFGLEPRTKPYIWKIRKGGYNGVDIPIVIQHSTRALKCSKTVILAKRTAGEKDKVTRLASCK